MSAITTKYTDEQREAMGAAMVGGLKAREVVEHAAAGTLKLDGRKLDAFVISNPSTVRDQARRFRRRRAGRHARPSPTKRCATRSRICGSGSSTSPTPSSRRSSGRRPAPLTWNGFGRRSVRPRGRGDSGPRRAAPCRAGSAQREREAQRRKNEGRPRRPDHESPPPSRRRAGDGATAVT